MVECMWHRCARQTALERQDLSRMYLAQHELESELFVIIIIIIVIVYIAIVIIILIVTVIIIFMCYRPWA